MPTSPHANATGTDLHEDKRIKAPVNAASTAQVSLATPGTTLDGVTLASGNRILLKNQTAPAENGIYVWTGAAVALTRATDADVAADFTLGFVVFVAAGTINVSTLWLFSQTAAVTLGTTALTFAAMGATGPTGATGATGATGTSGSVGPPGPPTTVSSALYVCIQDRKAAGTDGGSFTSGADRTRDLNFFVANDQNLASLVANRITLPAGTYRAMISCPSHAVDQNVAWLYNFTDSVDLLRGQNSFSAAASNSIVNAIIHGRFSLSSTKTLEVRHRCFTTKTTDGFGAKINSSFTVPYEIYTVAEFWLEGLPDPVSKGMSGQLNQPLDLSRRRAYLAAM